MWCIPKITPEFRKLMYNLLDLYAESYDSTKPLIGIDEKPKQLLGEKRMSLPMKQGRIEKYDYEYIRNGSANIFMAVEPKGGKRFTQITRQRTKKDFALFVRELIDKKYPKQQKIRIVVDNLNTHNSSSFYETFNKKEAQRILKRLNFIIHQKHASWLNVAEIEIGIMDWQCTNRRIKNIEKLKDEVGTWMRDRNKKKIKINWKFTKNDADKKLKKYYVT